tara:strand:+ start:1893 stop:3959 length:2067 start_codon:yes stop_codon:yes gene_type:complete
VSDTLPLVVAIDVGGTFTDVILVDGESGRRWITKTPSTPSDQSIGFFTGLEKVTGQANIDSALIRRVFHGSTVATNAILEGKGARTGMLVTDGFKYVLEIGRHDIPRKENLYTWIKPVRPVPPRRIREVPERVLLDGSIERSLDAVATCAAIEELKEMGVESVAVVFLHSYANAVNEKAAAALLAEHFPEAHVSISSDVLPVFREFERAMVTVLNAFIHPQVSRYIGGLSAGLKQRSIDAPLLIMKSNGGVFGPRQAANQAINMALSGPAAGVIGAGVVAKSSGHLNAITIDIGGTSADVSLIRSGQPAMTNESEIGPFPIQIPTIDIHTIGAGGGSVATVSDYGVLTVGPQSAGADPGPACYGKGGQHPTVTDANLVLGRIPEYLLGGEVELERDQAKRAIVKYVADPLGMDLYEAAAGILDIVNNNMVGALKVVSVEKGYDPGEFALIAFGGAGPMHASELSRQLGTKTVVIPALPGILCAVGLLATDLQYDYVRTCLQRAPEYDLELMRRVFGELSTLAQQGLNEEGVSEAQRNLDWLADVRYAKQGYEITVQFPTGDVNAETVSLLVEDFHQRHEQLYTFCDREAAVEIVNLRIKATGIVDKLELSTVGSCNGTDAKSRFTREVYFSDRGFQTTPVYAREDLLAGHTLKGPAIVDQLDTTTVVFPREIARVDAQGAIFIEIDHE